MLLTTDSTHLQDDHQRVPIVQHGPRRLRHNRRAQTSTTEAEVTMAIILDLPSTPSSDTNNRDTSPSPPFATRRKRKNSFLAYTSPRSRPVSILFPFSRYKFGINKIHFNTRIWHRFPCTIFLSTYPRLATILLHSPSAYIPAILSKSPRTPRPSVSISYSSQYHTPTKFDRKMISPRPPCFEPASLDPQYTAQRPHP